MTHTVGAQSSLTAAVAHVNVRELLRAADSSRIAACLPDRQRHRTPRRRPAWWLRITTRTATVRTV